MRARSLNRIRRAFRGRRPLVFGLGSGGPLVNEYARLTFCLDPLLVAGDPCQRLVRALMASSLWVTIRITALSPVGGGMSGRCPALSLLFDVRRGCLERSFFPYAVILQVTPIVCDRAAHHHLGQEHPLSLLHLRLDRRVLSGRRPTPRSASKAPIPSSRHYSALRRRRVADTAVAAASFGACPISSAGLSDSGGLALIGAVVAEFVAGTGGTESGLAYRILKSAAVASHPRVFAALVLISATGLAIFAALSFLSNRLLRHWHESGNS